MRAQHALDAIGSDEHARIAVEVRAGVVAIERQAMVAQVIAVAAIGIVALKPPLEQQHMLAGLGEHTCRDAAACTGTDDDHVIVERAGEGLRRLSVASCRPGRPLGQAVLVAKHPPRRSIRVTAIIRIGIDALGHQFAEFAEPPGRAEASESGVLFCVGAAGEVSRQRAEIGGNRRAQLG
ncbi:hypothetical protein, partial [Devosia insulae]|uniref:hypothetical protein n=1 Tax=Devosia insulae TaxID=408174 RepID=UPI001FCD1B16